jgi:hypothetical protein
MFSLKDQASDLFARLGSFIPVPGMTMASAEDLLTPLPDAIAELHRRRTDPKLREAVRAFLGDDVPDYCCDEPILYLARHIATPNFETCRFRHLTAETGMKTVIGQDTNDLFVSRNPLKRALGRLPIYLGKTGEGGAERFQKVSIIDFNSSDGKPFKDVRTLWGQSLAEFHTELSHQFLQGELQIVDDADWISRNGRGNLLEHYKRFLALFIVDGILFEDYLAEDRDERAFIRNVLRPAFAHIERKFGVAPLITHLTTTTIESEMFWYAYPKEVLDVVNTKMKNSLT